MADKKIYYSPTDDQTYFDRAKNAIVVTFGEEIKIQHEDVGHTVTWTYANRVALVTCSCAATFSARV